VNILNKHSYKFDRIEIKGNKIYPDYQILGVLDIEPGEEVDKAMLSEKTELLYGKAWFEKVKYRIVPRNDSLVLVIDCVERPKGMAYGSVHYDNILGAGVIVGMSVKNLLTQKSVININSYIAKYYRFELNAIQLIDRNQKFGFSANFYADNTLIPILSMNGNKDDVISRNFIPGASVIRSIGLNQMMGLSLKYENMNLVPQYSSDNQIRNVAYNYLASSFDYEVNSIDNKHFPDRGVLLKLSAGTSKLISSITKYDSSKAVTRIETSDGYLSERFYTLYGHLKYYFSPSSKVTFSVGGDALFISATDSLSAQNNFYLLGGVESVNNRSVPLIGYHSNEITVTRLASLRTDLDFELFKDVHLEIMANVAAVDKTENNDGLSIMAGYGLGIGYMSRMGPLRIGIMHGNSSADEYFNNIKGYINIGFKF
jgi:NTE family protein